MGISCAIDLGTSGVKVALVSADGEFLAREVQPYDVATPHRGWAETDPREWWAAIERALEALPGELLAQVTGVGLDGQMHGLAVVRGTEPVRPAILWPDGRASEMLDAWRGLPEGVRAKLANPVVAGMFGPILHWLVAREPETVAGASGVCFAKDWIRMQLTGEATQRTDFSDASASLLWDVAANDWHADIVQAFGLPRDLLPRAVLATERAGVVREGLRLPAGASVSVGCGDTAATLTAAQLEPGEALVNLGTGIQVCQTGAVPQATATPTCHTYADATGGWYSMVAPQNGGLALGRVVSLLGASWAELYDSLDAPADTSVTFDATFASERLPEPDAGGHAGWSGLGLETSRQTLLRSALEAIATRARGALEALPRRPEAIRFAGGGVRDPRMRQLLCDVTGLPGRMSTIMDATTLGAARLGFAAAGEPVSWAIPREEEWVRPRR